MPDVLVALCTSRYCMEASAPIDMKGVRGGAGKHFGVSLRQSGPRQPGDCSTLHFSLARTDATAPPCLWRVLGVWRYSMPRRARELWSDDSPHRLLRTLFKRHFASLVRTQSRLCRQSSLIPLDASYPFFCLPLVSSDPVFSTFHIYPSTSGLFVSFTSPPFLSYYTRFFPS